MKFMYTLLLVTALVSNIVLAWLQIETIKRVKLLEEHTNICGETLKAQGYALDVLTELQKEMK